VRLKHRKKEEDFAKGPWVTGQLLIKGKLEQDKDRSKVFRGLHRGSGKSSTMPAKDGQGTGKAVDSYGGFGGMGESGFGGNTSTFLAGMQKGSMVGSRKEKSQTYYFESVGDDLFGKGSKGLEGDRASRLGRSPVQVYYDWVVPPLVRREEKHGRGLTCDSYGRRVRIVEVLRLEFNESARGTRQVTVPEIKKLSRASAKRGVRKGEGNCKKKGEEQKAY